MRRRVWVEYRYTPETVEAIQARVNALPPGEPRWKKWAPRSPVVFEEVLVENEMYEASKTDRGQEMLLLRWTYDKVQYANYVYIHFDDGTFVVFKDRHDKPHVTKVALS